MKEGRRVEGEKVVNSKRVEAGDERDDHPHGEQRAHDEVDVGATQRMRE